MDWIGYVLIDGLDFDFVLDSGFRLQRDSPEYRITKSDDYYVREINGKNASEEYSKIQHLQPYFLNMLSNMMNKSNFTYLMKSLSQASKVMYEGTMKFAVKFVGREVYPGVVEILACFELGKDYLLAQTSYPEGTVLKRVVTTPEDQLSAYDRLKAKLNNPKAIIINSCLMRAYWSDFQFDKSKEKLKLFPCPVIEIYLWGELGVPVPYKNPNHNILAGGTMKALILK